MEINKALDALNGLLDTLYVYCDTEDADPEFLAQIDKVEEAIINYVKSKGDYR